MGDTFVFVAGPNKGNVVSLTDIVVGAAPVTVQAWDTASGSVREDDNSTVLLWRVAPESVPAELKQDAAEGVLAYSAVCTHLGCMLSDWRADQKQFFCPCHDATFDPMQGGKNTGGAASRTLPILPLKVVDGKLVAADVFVGYVGVKRS